MKKSLLGCLTAGMMFLLCSMTVLAATGKAEHNGKIREGASTSSEQIGSVAAGQSMELFEAVKGDDGHTWYKVSVEGGKYGYVRDDVVTTSDTVPQGTAPAAAATESAEAPAADSAPEEKVEVAETTGVTPVAETEATVKSTAKVRSGASTSHEKLTTLDAGAKVTIIGQVNDPAGDTWYQVRVDKDGTTTEGFILGKLLNLPEGGVTPVEETAETEEYAGEDENDEYVEEEPVVENNDYEVVYTMDDSDGQSYYYLYDNVEGTRQKIDEILNTVDQANAGITKLKAQVSKYKLIVIILAVVAAILLAVMIVLIIKLHNAYDYEYEDDDEYEEEEEEPEYEERPRRRSRDEEEAPKRRAEEDAPRRPREEAPARRPREEEESVPVSQANIPSEVPKKSQRKAKNFLADDEFEFEFLNMDDKDL